MLKLSKPAFAFVALPLFLALSQTGTLLLPPFFQQLKEPPQVLGPRLEIWNYLEAQTSVIKIFERRASAHQVCQCAAKLLELFFLVQRRPDKSIGHFAFIEVRGLHFGIRLVVKDGSSASGT